MPELKEPKEGVGDELEEVEPATSIEEVQVKDIMNVMQRYSWY